MRTPASLSVVAIAALIVGTPLSAARSADLAVKAPPAPVAPVYNWTGFYVGVDAGYVWDSVTVYDPALPADGSAAGHPNSGTFGGHVGYMYQFNPQWVIGVEGDASWLNGSAMPAFSGLPATFGSTETSKWDASARGTLGYVIDTNLLYVTGGAAWIRGDGCTFRQTAPGVCGPGVSYGVTQDGWTVGGGLAHAFTQNLIGRLEYLYADYGTATVTGAFSGGSENITTKINKLRAGLTWKF